MLKVKEWTGDEKVAIKDIVADLNKIFKMDPDLMNKFMKTYFPCNYAVRDCEGVQVKCYDEASTENPQVSFIGLLNGLLGVDKIGVGPVSAILDKGTVVGFQVSDTAAFAKGE